MYLYFNLNYNNEKITFYYYYFELYFLTIIVTKIPWSINPIGNSIYYYVDELEVQSSK